MFRWPEGDNESVAQIPRGAVVTLLLKNMTWAALLLVLVLGGLTGATRAQQDDARARDVRTQPQIPQPDFHTPEDTSKTGEPHTAILPGVRPDYHTPKSQLTVLKVQGNIYFIGGAGANVTVQVGDDGVMLVDTGLAESAEKIMAAYKTLSPRLLRWIVNTSADLSNTGGNEVVAKSGAGVSQGGGAAAAGQAFQGSGAGVIAFENVLNRMSAPTGEKASRPTDAWPTSTYFTSKKQLWFNNEPVDFYHLAAAHGDGDTMVHFRQSDVIAAGNVYNTDRYPFFDIEQGGTIQGVLDALNKIIDITVPAYNMQGGTRVIPGFGRISNEADVVEIRDMSTIVRDRVMTMMKRGMTLAQIREAQPSLDYDGIYGSTTGPWTTDMFYDALYKDLSRVLAPPKPAPKPPARR